MAADWVTEKIQAAIPVLDCKTPLTLPNQQNRNTAGASEAPPAILKAPPHPANAP